LGNTSGRRSRPADARQETCR